MPPPERTVFQFDAFRIDTDDRLLTRGDRAVPLPPKALETLLSLLRGGGRVVKTEELIRHVWPDTFVEPGGLYRNIHQIKKVLGAGYIENIPKVGFRWVGPLEVSIIDSGPAVKSLVVLPLENLSGDPLQDVFAAGTTEALLANLWKISALKVIYVESKAKAGPETAREWRADAALTGSVVAAGDRVRITVRVVRATSGEHLLATEQEGYARDILQLQAAAARAVAEAVRAELTCPESERLARSRQVNPDAHLEYLKGRFLWNRRRPDTFQRAIAHFMHSLELDPGYAPAYAGMADVYALLGSTSYDALPPREVMPKAKAAALAALKLDETLAEAHASLAYVLLSYDWDWTGAESEFRRALELSQGYATAHHWYGHYFLAMGRTEDALREMRAAQERDPLSVAVSTGIGWCFYLARRYNDAIEQFLKTLNLERDFVIAQSMLGMAYTQKGAYSEAIAALQQALTVAPDNAFALSRLGETYAESGRRREAQNLLKRLNQLSGKQYVPAVYQGSIYAALGDIDQAFACAQRALSDRSHYLAYIGVEPSLDRMRLDPRFPELLKKIGLPKTR